MPLGAVRPLSAGVHEVASASVVEASCEGVVPRILLVMAVGDSVAAGVDDAVNLYHDFASGLRSSRR